MKYLRPVVLALAASITVYSAPLSAQTTAPHQSTAGFWTVVQGVIGGAGLAMAYIAPQGEGWVVADETAVPLFATTGVAAALVARGLSSRLEPTDPHRPQFRLAAGRSEKTRLDYSLAVRAPVSPHFAVQGAIFLASNDWEETARETRCDYLFGCITADYIVDARYEQSLSAMASGVYALRSDVNTTISFGVGPAITKVENHEEVRTKHAGAIAELMLGVENGNRSHWTLEVGTRVITGTGSNKPIMQARFGRAFGY